jgi:hypothetical protein
LIKIIYNRPVNLTWYAAYAFHYQSGIINPKTFRRNQNLETLKFDSIDNKTVIVEIPANSTSRIEANYNQMYFKNIKSIEFNNQKLTIQEFFNSTTGDNTKRVFKINGN